MTALVLGLGLATIAHAQTAGTEVQRDINQQNRIEQGLQSGQLNAKEAGKLERGEARIDRMESNAMKERWDAFLPRGNSASSQQMQTDVQRNANQERRIQQGA